MVVQSDTWLDGMAPFSQGALLARRGTVVLVVPNSTLAQRYGGMGNLAALTQTGDDAGHADLGD
jgi:hypothetical protein